MALTTWNPFREMEELLERYGRSTGKELSRANGNAFETSDWVPSVDISETPETFLIKAELPGVDKKDISVNLDNHVLTIKGEKKVETKDEKNHRIECSYGSFVRSFTLPINTQTEDVQASYGNGVLHLTVPKKEEAKPKQIEVTIK